MTINQSCYGIVGKEGLSDSFIYYLTLLNIAELRRKSHGSVFSTITRDTFKSINNCFGGVKLSLDFENAVRPMLNKILANSKQCVAIESTRDMLLPKLLSGELTIPDAEKLVANAL